MASHPAAQRWRLAFRTSGLALGLLCGPHLGYAQAPSSVATDPQPASPVSIDLDQAIRRAQTNEPAFAGALAEKRATALDRSIARAALLPSAEYHNQYLFTQSNGALTTNGQGGSQPAPIFIANNAVHEYASQGSVNELVGLRQFAGVAAASAGAARAEAELEVARRGLVSAVVGLFYGASVSQRKLQITQQALKEAADFTDLTRKREAAREGAHADVLKAQLQQQQRQREATDAQLTADRSRLELGVLLFPDPRTPYTLLDRTTPDLPARSEIEARAAANNAELKSALATLRVSDAEVLSARSAYLPDLALNFTYGIDAPQFARYGTAGVKNLGYSASATLDIPLWDWLATEHRVKQTQIRREAVRVALTATQRRLIAALDEGYAEAVAARDQAASLDQSVQTAAESLRLTRLRYADGEATVLEVVDAQSALLGSQNAREDGFARYQAALANLQTLTGVL
jgi:outer membrane protein TolC